MQIVRFYVGDTLEMKKSHPCGDKHFEVLRVGAQVRVRCTGCGRDMVLDRIKLERAIRRVHSAPADDTAQSQE
ncbi:MAG: DUF951 domain-containing protein [Clostridia bacterium]|nr:DUF951 domain-containing protein [Clostridia bacterium]